MENKHTAEVMYKSEEKNFNNEPFFEVKKARGYYVYGERLGKDSIFFILMNKNYNNTGKTKYCLITESKPPMDERYKTEVKMTTAFGGSVDIDEKLEDICKKEVVEESGYEVAPERIRYMGQTMVSTQMSQMAHGYLVDVTNLEKTQTAEWEESKGEFEGNSVKWMTKDEVIENSDWKSIFIVAKL